MAETNDDSSTARKVSHTPHTLAGVSHANPWVSDDDDQSNSDQSSFSISLIRPGFKFSHFGEQLNSKGGSEDSTRSEEPKEFKPKPPFCSSPLDDCFILPTDLKGIMPLGHSSLLSERISPLGSANSTEDQKGNLPLSPLVNRLVSPTAPKGKLPSKPEFTPIFDALEHFQKSQGSEGEPTPITLDDLNIRMVGKAARKARKDGGNFGSLVNIFQAHSLMPQRLRPELTKLQIPTNRQHQSSGYPEPPVFSPGPAMRVFTRLSDAETEVSSTFGEDLEKYAGGHESEKQSLRKYPSRRR